MPDLDRFIDSVIRKAMEEGKFDNLRGAGKPLDLQQYAHVDPAWRTAYTLLKDENFTLPWMNKRNEIEAELETLLADLKRSWAWRGRELDKGRESAWVEAEWSRAIREFTARIAALNAKIDGYNLEVPAAIFQRARVDAGREIEQVVSSMIE
jgi:hypothetical protein